MTRKIFAIVAVLFMGTLLGVAQKDAIHLVGNVARIAGDTVTVSVPDSTTSADVVLQSTTTYKVGVKPATRAELQMGDSVNIVVVRKNPDWLAQSVKITHPKK